MTGDRKYIIKSASKQETTFLTNIGNKYVRHHALNPLSLIVRIVGMFSVKFGDRKRDRFIVMLNVDQSGM